MKRLPPWGDRPERAHPFHTPSDPNVVRADVMDVLMERQPLTTVQIITALKGRSGAEAIRQCLRFLQEQGYVTRENNRYPWRLKQK